MKPVQVYFEHGNVIIALDRSIREEDGRRVCYEERGYCVQPSVSCSGLVAGDGHWQFKAEGSGGSFGGLYEYVWKNEWNAVVIGIGNIINGKIIGRQSNADFRFEIQNRIMFEGQDQLVESSRQNCRLRPDNAAARLRHSPGPTGYSPIK